MLRLDGEKDDNQRYSIVVEFSLLEVEESTFLPMEFWRLGSLSPILDFP
jgi:hypothetical protein